MGHTAPVKCIAKATAGSEAHHVVTSSENGEMFAWDTVDGRCLENRKHPGYIHTSIQVMMDNYFESVRNHVTLEIRSFVIQNFDSLVKSNHYSVPILVLFATCNFLCIFN